MQSMQWTSRRLVSSLVRQEKYEPAAYVVLGAKSVFDLYSSLIEDTVCNCRKSPDLDCKKELEHILELAKEEIKEHRKWQEEVLSNLPKKSEALGLTGVLRLAFADASEARKKLLQQTMSAHGELFDSPTTAVELFDSPTETVQPVQSLVKC